MQKVVSEFPFEYTRVGQTNFSSQEAGFASIIRTKILDFYLHEASFFSVSFPQSGRSSVEWKTPQKLSRHLVTAGFLSIQQGYGQNAFRTTDVVESLILNVYQNQIDSIAEAESFTKAKEIVLIDNIHGFHPETLRLARQFHNFIKSPRSASKLYAETIWTQIVLQLIWNFSSLARMQDIHSERLSDIRMQKVIDFMQGSLNHPISLQDLAHLVDLSPNYFLNAFKKATGKTPHHYLRELRIKKACELLSDPLMTINGIALHVGYSSQSHFTSSFRKVMGVTPAVYQLQKYGNPKR